MSSPVPVRIDEWYEPQAGDYFYNINTGAVIKKPIVTRAYRLDGYLTQAAAEAAATALVVFSKSGSTVTRTTARAEKMHDPGPDRWRVRVTEQTIYSWVIIP